MIISNSAVSSLAVTKSDTTPVNCEAIYIGGAGNIAIKHDASSTAVTYLAVPVGTILPIRIRNGMIMSTDTTATNIVAMSF